MKVFIILITLLFSCFNGFAQKQSKNNRPKVGLVLCGGGAKGAAHVGVLKVLEEANVPIDIIVGTSVGGLVGGLYSMGYSANKLDTLISNLDWGYLLSDNTQRVNSSFAKKTMDDKYLLRIPFYSILSEKDKSKREELKAESSYLPAGFISGQNVLNLLNGLSIGYQDSIKFKDLPIPFACVSTNLSTGEAVVLKEGILPLAMRATMAIPGVFAPVKMGDKVLVDGGIVDNFPVDIAREMGADIIIGVDIQNDLAKPEQLNSISQVLNQIMGLMGNDRYLENIKKTDILIKPDVSNFGTYSFNKPAIDTLIVNGYIAAMEKIADLKTLSARMRNYGVYKNKLNAAKATNVNEDYFIFSKIELVGIPKSDSEWLKKTIGIKENEVISGEEINRAVSILMGTRAFAFVNYSIKKDENGRDVLSFSVKRGPSNVLAVGARYDSEEAAAILLHLGVHEYDFFGSKLGVTGRLSYNPYGLIDYSYTFRHFPKVGLSYKISGVDMNIYQSAKDRNYLAFIHQEGKLNLTNRYLRNFNFELGARWDRFNFDANLKSVSGLGGNKVGLDAVDRSYISYYLTAKMDSRDDKYFPNSGMSFNASGDFCHTNFQKDFTNFATTKLSIQGAVSVGKRLTLLPALFGRVIIGNCDEVPFYNYIGGSESGRYFSQQLPFIGVNYADLVSNSVIIGRMDLRGQVADKHYVYVMANYMRTGPKFEDIIAVGGTGAIGVGLKYAYNSNFGPLSFNIHWSNKNERVGAYINLGYYF
jgi:Predicted esterase of the alpha-beta hydrolase superfamily